MRSICLLLYLALTLPLMAQNAPPEGKLLFQPRFVWADGEVTRQGTGYLIEHGPHTLGVTSIHFLNFEGPGLSEAVWLDIPSYEAVHEFRESLGRPGVRSIETYDDIQHDFVLMPAAKDSFPDHVRLPLDTRPRLNAGEKLWFPNKDFEQEIGHTWVQAQITEDHGSYLEVELMEELELQSQSGSPLISQENGRVVGMLMGATGEGKEARLWFCPARGIRAFLAKEQPTLPLAESIN